MVFRAERYPADWKAIRAGVLMRANNRCERCLAPNREVIARHVDGTSYMLQRGDVFDADDGRHLGVARGSEYDAQRFVKVVLTVAHLDHDERHNNPNNLRALCQRCHLRHDARDNARRRRAARTPGQLSLPGAKP
jgi:5-methylcytosine-specific restriction endonuclease McrA